MKVWVIESLGTAVTNFKVGDHVLISCISSCGRCAYCRRSMYSHCASGGWLLGHTINGTQAEYVRVPHADTSMYPVPQGADEASLVMLSDILPLVLSAACSTEKWRQVAPWLLWVPTRWGWLLC